MLLDHGVDLNATDYGGFTALHLACELGHDRIVARLLEVANSAHQKTKNGGLTCLHLAAIRGHAKILELLLVDNSALVIEEDAKMRLPLDFAVEYGHEEIIGRLMEIAKSQPAYCEAMFHAAIRSNHHKIVTQLLDYRPQLIDVLDIVGSSPLEQAAEFCCDSIVAELFARRQPRLAEVGGNYRGSLLQFAAEFGYDTIAAELLVEQPHLVDVIAEDQKTVLHIAVENGHDKIVEQLLAHKPLLIDAKDFRGCSALHLAAERGRVEVLEQLLALKPESIDAEDGSGNTALHWACAVAPQPRAVACLLAHGPAVIRKEMLWGAFDHKDDTKIAEVVKLLCARKPELMESVNHQHNTLLHLVFGGRNDGSDLQFSVGLIHAVWELSPPHLLRATNDLDDTPVHMAMQSDNRVALGLIEGLLFLDEIAEACAQGKTLHSLSVLQKQFGKYLSVVPLGKDVVGLVWEYIGFERPKKRTRGDEALRQYGSQLLEHLLREGVPLGFTAQRLQVLV